MPDEFSEKPRILVLACENDAYPALDMAGMQKNCYSAFVRVIPVRCLGSVNTIWIIDALNAGFDGIMMMGCKHGDDYQCHFVKNDAYPALDMAGMQKNCYSAFVRVIPVRCLGSVNTIWIIDALNAGFDGIMMMGCK